MISARHVHLVVETKYRLGVPGGAMLSCCEAAMWRVCADFAAELREFDGEAGHLRLLGDYPPKVAVSALVNSLKGVPARRLRAEFTRRANRASMREHFWSASHFVGSCGCAPLSIMRQYIEQQ